MNDAANELAESRVRTPRKKIMQHPSPGPNRFTDGHYLQSLAIAKGDWAGALGFAEGQGHWADRSQVEFALKSTIAASATSDYPAGITAVTEAFLARMRGYSIPLRLVGLKRVPMRTRIYVNTAGIVVVRVDEGTAMPVLRGTWDTATLEPIKHGGIVVATDDLVRSMSPTASAAFTDDLAASTAEAENLSFVSPDLVGSVLYGAPSFAGTGSALANKDADLKRLMGSVPGAFREGTAFVMTQGTATEYTLTRGTGGAPAYPGITPQGGTLMGLPVLITSACERAGSPPTRIVGLLSPSEIFWADDGRVVLSASTETLIEMDDDPSGNSLTPQGTTGVSMFQAGAVALRAVRESAWYARAGSGAYFVAGY